VWRIYSWKQAVTWRHARSETLPFLFIVASRNIATCASVLSRPLRARSVLFIVFSEFLKDFPTAFHRKCTHAGVGFVERL